MYRIELNYVKNIHEFEELIKVFLRPSDYVLINNGTIIDNLKTLANLDITDNDKSYINITVPDDLALNFNKPEGRNVIKQFIFDSLSLHTGLKPDWGIHTGVRPVKLASELSVREGSEEKAKQILLEYYRMSQEKVDLIMHINNIQKCILGRSNTNAVGLYIGIPFCPTRCVYCSFTSNQASENQINSYLEALHYEISFVGKRMQSRGLYPESVYIGGGTPTTLSKEQLDKLLMHVKENIDLSKTKEITVEAGRPDTITREKLEIIKKHEISRISINPQSMKAKTLELIGRSHCPEDIIEAFKVAREVGIKIINADIIAGLPEEDVDDFKNTLRSVLELKPENITVHTLALKRASRLKLIDSDYNYKQSQIVREMLEQSRMMLSESGFEPYYLYRQKQMTGNFENIGYAKPHAENIYNIRIMEEMQTIIALGAGGITKVYYQEENRLERVPNVSNYEIYVERIDEMLERKEKGLFNT
ncbi:coproporphyrinogen dehydrogenase HemZ [Anaerovorax odorimutans]|uniref:coproporphyrinogen dehydrogenase HemZ n=1 Tax=Anaerovorax odorimutans TaxID=109327 RepID=UPI0003F5B310|nr:coproporphyrinogen dehydrogenase HemZ [Anaerovorax odorimutans]